MSRIKSIKGFFGQIIHYKDGVRVGETWDGLVPGTKKHYDANGQYAGSSAPGFLADQVHYDALGRRVGETWTDSAGISRHYDDRGRAGTSYDGFAGRTSVFYDEPSDPYSYEHVQNSRSTKREYPSFFDDDKDESMDLPEYDPDSLW